MAESYDVIVIGLGAMGSATVYELSRRRQRVLGLDAYERGHTRGSSHGRSRIIRQAYSTPDYVPLVMRAFSLWRELEAACGRSLLTMTGMLLLGRRGSAMIDGPIESARVHHLPFEVLSASEVTYRFPGFQPSDDLVAVYDPGAGFLRPEECVGAFLDCAALHGATIRHQELVTRWSADGTGVRVESAQGIYHAERLVIAPGPWAGTLLADLALPLSVQRMVNVHVQPAQPDLFAPERCPVFGWDIAEGHYFGFPNLPSDGMKVGSDSDGTPCTPETIDRTVTRAEIDAFLRLLERYMPRAVGPITQTLTCMYTNTPDKHFIIDRHPASDRVIYACGFSGHGFKFASVVGEILAELVMDGATVQPIAFLRASRYSRR